MCLCLPVLPCSAWVGGCRATARGLESRCLPMCPGRPGSSFPRFWPGCCCTGSRERCAAALPLTSPHAPGTETGSQQAGVPQRAGPDHPHSSRAEAWTCAGMADVAWIRESAEVLTGLTATQCGPRLAGRPMTTTGRWRVAPLDARRRAQHAPVSVLRPRRTGPGQRDR